jgi:hypothetical protein
VPKKDDPIRRDNTDIEMLRRRWPNRSDDEILKLLSEFTADLDSQEEQDKRDGKA